VAESEDIDAQLRAVLPRLRRFAQWLCRDAIAADDLVQATLERAISRWGERRDPEALRAWLFQILYRRFIDGRRREKRENRFLGEQDRSARQPSVEAEVAANATLRAFSRLPDDQQHLLYCVSVEGLSYRELAAMLEVPIGTVMSRLSRAREALRKLSEDAPPTHKLQLLK
jgi:RNA polymerase sigma-70 factor (ECF subfamily)